MLRCCMCLEYDTRRRASRKASMTRNKNVKYERKKGTTDTFVFDAHGIGLLDMSHIATATTTTHGSLPQSGCCRVCVCCAPQRDEGLNRAEHLVKTRNASPVVCLIHKNFFLSFLDFFHFFFSLTSALSYVPDHLVVVKSTFRHLQKRFSEIWGRHSTSNLISIQS